MPPLNLVADLAGGSMLAAFGICAALVERDRSGHGQEIDAAMTDGVLSMMEMWFNAWRTPLLPERGLGFTTGAAPFYRCYQCADGRYVAVGAVEDGFFRALWDGLDLPPPYPTAALRPGRLAGAWPASSASGSSPPIGMSGPPGSPGRTPASPPCWTPGEVLAAEGRPGPVPRFSRTPGAPGAATRASRTPPPTARRPPGLTDEDLKAVAEEAKQDGAFGFKWPPD